MRDREALDTILTRAASPWMDGSGHLADVVLSSRVRLARNLKDVPFPHLLRGDDAKEVMFRIKKAVDSVNGKGAWGVLHFVDLETLMPLDRMVLVEKHLISPQHAQAGACKGLAFREDEALDIMVNEEDHIRLQCLYSGLELEEAWVAASGMDDLLEEVLPFAYLERLGYLTACPTNAGTGLRASVMVHLAGLSVGGQVGRVLTAVNKVGLVVRGLYGEGTEGQGNVFQISNQITLGQTEKEIIDNLSTVAQQVVSEEKRMRETLLRSNRQEVEDRVWRSMGILSNARALTSKEAMKLWSDVRMGVDMGIIPHLTVKEINEVMVMSRPNFVQKVSGREMSPSERDTKRAEIIRNHLSARSR